MKSWVSPFAGLLVLISTIVTVLIAEGVSGVIVGSLVSFSVIFLFGSGVRRSLLPVLRLWPFFLFIFVLNAIFGTGEADIWSWWIFTVSWSGIRTGLIVIWRCIAVSAAASAYIAVSTPMEMTDSLSRLLSPLGWIGLPVERLSFIMSMSLFFVPELTMESEKIVRAQKARGIAWGGKGLIDKARSYLPMVIPLFMAALRRADDMGRALVSRGFSFGMKSGRAPLSLSFRDIAVSAVYIVFIFISKRSFI